MRTAQEDGEVGPVADPEAIATEVMAFVAGMQVQWLLHPEAVELPAAYRRYVEALIARLREAERPG